jgi:hypothetical protein
MTMTKILFPVWLGLASCTGNAQTQIDLSRQSKGVDFSAAPSTKPMKAGQTLPATCTVGELFFRLNAPAGLNLYACTTVNTWTLEVGSVLPGVTNNPGKVLATDGTNLNWTTFSGDVGGVANGLVVTQLQGRAVSPSAPVSGQALAWNANSTRWEPQNMNGNFGDLTVTLTSGTQLTIGPSCSSTTPCRIRIGNVVYSVNAPSTATLGGGTGTAYIYAASDGLIYVGHTMTVSCNSGCIAQSGQSSFPNGSIPLATWTATGGTWDATGYTDRRAFLSTTGVSVGQGLLKTEAGGSSTISVDGNLIGMRVTVPAASTSACTQNSWAADTSYYYICVNTDTWVRWAVQSW